MPKDLQRLDESRPSPEALLESAKQEHRGNLKIFLGAAPGVGKTYTMLEAAQAKRRGGVDVVVGLVETHGRVETEALLKGLEIIPRHKIEHRGKALGELDLDAVLARKPQLVLVDELAHTNAPSSRHAKRYFDVEELLKAGIDVYTTVNIQHIESLKDAVAQITGIWVRETVPDLIFDRANEVELVDLSPEELLQRLRDGKVYVPEQAKRAIQNYFRPGNLSALRQLALRRMAERVDQQMQTYMEAHAIPGPWSAVERIMVCVGPSPLSPRLVRAARRMASSRHAEWLAVYLETPAHHRLSQPDQDRVVQTLRLAEQLGGEAVTVAGNEPAEDLIKYAQSRNVTEIVVGKSMRPWWLELYYGSLVDQLIRMSGNIDVHVITAMEPETTPVQRPASSSQSGPINFAPFLWSLVAVIAAALISKILEGWLSVGSFALIFLIAVLWAAIRHGYWPAILAAILSELIYNFFLVPPYYTFVVHNSQDVLTLVIFLLVAVLTSNIAARLQSQSEANRRREASTAFLYSLSREIARATDLNQVLQVGTQRVSEILNGKAAILLPEQERLVLKASYPVDAQTVEADRAAATWAWQNNQSAGRGADTLPGVPWYFLPLSTSSHGVLGVIGLRFESAQTVISPDQRRMLQALADQIGSAIERIALVREIEDAKLLKETERLQSALLSSISHDLRTPLASIMGGVTSLIAFGKTFSDEVRGDLYETIRENADLLNRFVGNLLDMTRIESGALTLNKQWVEVGDLVGSALNRTEQLLSPYRVIAEIEPKLPLLDVDFLLIEQVLVNLLDNAAKYSSPKTKIVVKAFQIDDRIFIKVIDEGPGIPETELERIFDKFYRIYREDRKSAGTGLGLSICRGFIEAHGGKIWAASPSSLGKGSEFTIELPIPKERPIILKE